METYKELESELYHKGHGARMESRKMAPNTWLKRRGDRIAVRLHQTDILTYTPDERIILDDGGWQTYMTKERMNRFLGNNTISGPNQTRRRYSNLQPWQVEVMVQVTHNGEPYLMPAQIEFFNGLTLNTSDSTVAASPSMLPIDLDDEIRRATARTNILNPVMAMLEERTADGSITKDNLDYATMMAERFQEQHDHLRSLLLRQEGAAHWKLQRFHDLFKQAVTRHAEVNYDKHERNKEVKGQIRVKELITPVDRSNNT